MLIFESQTPQELLREVARYLRDKAQREQDTGRQAKPQAAKVHHARSTALVLAAMDLESAGIMPPERPEFTAMQYDHGCPECGSDETYATAATIDLRDNVPVSLCDACGHVEEKFPDRTQTGLPVTK